MNNNKDSYSHKNRSVTNRKFMKRKVRLIKRKRRNLIMPVTP